MTSFDKTKLCFLPVQAQLRDVCVTEDAVREAINFAIANANKRQGQDVAEVDPIGANQKPRMLQLSAWIAHSGPPNLNDMAFTDVDLASVVKAGLFQPPFFGMIDFNHDFTSYGAWYKAQFLFDPKVQQWGILAEGAIFAWRFTDLADKMLAMQMRQGHIDVSMACMPKSYEEATTPEGRRYVILRDPVFFTTSLLDVSPADPAARGLGSEDPAQTSDERAAELLRASIEATNTEEVFMTEAETKAKEAADAAAAQAVLDAKAKEKADADAAALAAQAVLDADAAAAIAAIDAGAAAALAEANKATATLTDTQAQLAAALVEVEAQTTARQTAEAALTVAKTEIDRLNADLKTLTDFKAQRETLDREAAIAEVRKVRETEIPAAIRAALDNDEGVLLIAKWMEQSDDMWEGTKKVFELSGASRLSLAERTAREGTLLTGTDALEGEFAIAKWRK
jgi:hypothetical protein